MIPLTCLCCDWYDTLFSRGLPQAIQFICFTAPQNSGHMTALQFQFSHGFKREFCSFQAFPFSSLSMEMTFFAAFHTLCKSQMSCDLHLGQFVSRSENSLIFSSVVNNLLLIPSNVFFISGTVFFNSTHSNFHIHVFLYISELWSVFTSAILIPLLANSTISVISCSIVSTDEFYSWLYSFLLFFMFGNLTL